MMAKDTNKLSRPGTYTILTALIFWCTIAGVAYNLGLNIPKLNQQDEDLSFCSEKATQVGKGQKVVSFSLFRKSTNPSQSIEEALERYLPGIQKNLVAIREFYPGWLMRLYTNVVLLSKSLESEPDFFICNSTSLPILGNVTSIDGMLWRFLPIADPTVDLFLVRDLDSIINNREQEAVTEWLQSNKTFHSMRDHPWHGVAILGGMWGSKNMLLDKYDREYLLHGFLNGTLGGDDQSVLSAVLYKKYSSRFLEHDSYLCKAFIRSVPFPKQRQNNTQYVGGNKLYMSPNKTVNPCPMACRPDYGKDWIYC